MTLPRSHAFSLLLRHPLPRRGTIVIEVVRAPEGGWTAWLVDMDAPENTRSLGPFRGRREARRAAKAALDGATDCPAPVQPRGGVREARALFGALPLRAGHVRLRGV